MGANSEIKQLSNRLKDEASTLFPTHKSKSIIVAALLGSPWVKKASSLCDEGGAGCGGHFEGGGWGKAYREAVSVRWDRRRKRFVSFRWRRRVYPIDSILSSWVTEKGWWDPEREVNQIFVRLISRGGIYDLFYDRLRKQWFLDEIID